MTRNMLVLILIALTCSGCLFVNESDECAEFEFEGEIFCTVKNDPVNIGLQEAEPDGKVLQISERDAQRYRLEPATPLVPAIAEGTAEANIERTGPGVSTMCFEDGIHIEDTETGLRWWIVSPGECPILNGSAFVDADYK